MKRCKPKIGDLVRLRPHAELDLYVEDLRTRRVLSLVIQNVGIWCDIQLMNKDSHVYRVPRKILEIVSESR